MLLLPLKRSLWKEWSSTEGYCGDKTVPWGCTPICRNRAFPNASHSRGRRAQREVNHTSFISTTYPRKWRSNSQTQSLFRWRKWCELNNKQVSFYFCHLLEFFFLFVPNSTLVLDGLTPADALSSECARRDAMCHERDHQRKMHLLICKRMWGASTHHFIFTVITLERTSESRH